MSITFPFLGYITLGSILPPLPLPPFLLFPRDQAEHGVIFGKSGSGKSRLLERLFLEHFKKGHGVGILEPHDLSEDLLRHLVARGFFRKGEEAYQRLVYVDWGNGAYVPFNPIASGKPAHTVASRVLEAMLRVWPELKEGAPMFSTLVLASLVTLVENQLPITFLHRLLVDPYFRRACLEKVKDPLIHSQFRHYQQLGKREQAVLGGSTIRRAFLLSFAPTARLCLGQPEKWLDFEKLLNTGTSFIIGLGRVPEPEVRRLMGALIMTEIEQAAMDRVNLPLQERRPFTVLLDEWSAVSSGEETLANILDQCRKFKVTLYLAGQSVSGSTLFNRGHAATAITGC